METPNSIYLINNHDGDIYWCEDQFPDEHIEGADTVEYVKVSVQATRIGELESKLKEASEFIQKLGPTIEYDIIAEIEEMLK